MRRLDCWTIIFAGIAAGPVLEASARGQSAGLAAASEGKLRVSPTALEVTSTGGSQQLRAFLRSPANELLDITGDGALSYVSSDPSVVTVDATGVLGFAGVGRATVDTTYAGASGLQSGSTDITVDPGGAQFAEALFDSAGGALELADGTGIEVPPGALPDARVLQIEEVTLPTSTALPPGSSQVSSAYDFGPSGTVFDEDVRLTLAYGSVPGGYDEDSVLIHELLYDGSLVIEAYPGPLGEEDLVESVNQELDPIAGRVTGALVRHFSCRTALAYLRPETATLTAPDDTELDILRKLKTRRPNPGPDGEWGVPHCDDNGAQGIDDCGEFNRVGANCTGTEDDHVQDIDARTGTIQHIVLHSTDGCPGVRFSGEVNNAASDTWCYWAHYYVGKDGTIVQVSEDDDLALHVQGNAALGISNETAIGIEIYNNRDVEHYPGRQLAAIVRLCDMLLRLHPTIERPSAANPSGGIITHRNQDATPGRKPDPSREFQAAVMGSPSLEEILYRALRDDTNTGIINARGGDALGEHLPGVGGAVTLEMGRADLENPFDDDRDTILVPPGPAQPIGTGDLMHLLVAGTAEVRADVVLDLDGILYVGPDATLDARGGADGADAHSVSITADGFALIEGRVLVNGTDKLGGLELPPFETGTGNGPGGNGGDFQFASAAAGFQWVPSIVTRGGDGDLSASGVGPPIPGGNGGSISITAHENGLQQRIITLVRGHENGPSRDEHELGLPDYMPPPSPFNLMPIISASPIPSGSCPADPFATDSYLRPLAGERLATGRIIDPTTREVGANISLFRRGLLSAGGMGGVAGGSNFLAGPGGVGGSITLHNLTEGYIRFLDDVQLVSGSGAERIASVIFVAGGGCGDFKFFDMPSGGLGGRGGSTGGDGGDGGDAGAIDLVGIFWPNVAVPTTPVVTTTTPIVGFSGDNPNFSGGQQIGSLLTFGVEGFSTSSSKGSGGSPAGHPSSFPGLFGITGQDGITIINVTTMYP